MNEINWFIERSNIVEQVSEAKFADKNKRNSYFHKYYYYYKINESRISVMILCKTIIIIIIVGVISIVRNL